MFKTILTILGAGVICLPSSALGGKSNITRIKEWHGAPAIFINDKPVTALMYEKYPSAETPKDLPTVSGGKLKLQNHPGTSETVSSIQSTGTFDRSFTLTAEVCMDETTGSGDATMTLWVNNSRVAASWVDLSKTNGAYFFQLARVCGKNVVHLWKSHAGVSGFDKWFTLPLNWKLGEPVTLKLVMAEGGRMTAYANDHLVGEKVDENPLPPGALTISASQSISTVNFVRVTDPDGNVIFKDDFSVAKSDNWSGAPLGGPSPTFASAGLNISMPAIKLADIWQGPGRYDFRKLDTRTRSLLKELPDTTYVINRFFLDPPQWWYESYPDELAVWHDPAGNSGKLKWASFASDHWQNDTDEAIKAIVRHIEASDYADRIIGYNLLYAFGPEWEYPSGNTFHDFSPANLLGFKKWLKNAYGTDTGLSKAWNSPGMTIEGVEIPPVSDRLTGDYYDFFNPSGKGNRIMDYIRFNAESVVAAITRYAGTIKRVTGGRNLVLAHYGYHFLWPSINYSQRGHMAMDRFIACPDIDGTGSAYQYRVREAGGSTAAITTIGSLRLHNKMYILEDDTRTHLTPSRQEYGRARNLWETTNILRRNAAYTISEGVPLWFLDFGWETWFNHPDVMPVIAEMESLHKTALNKDRRRNAEIAVIVNQRSMTALRSSNALTVPVLAKQYFEELPRLGAPFDTYLLQDLDRIPDYKLYIFLDVFALNEQEKISIRRAVRRNDRTALWIYAPGYITEKGLSDNAMSEITGIRLLSREVAGQLSANLCDVRHPITVKCSPGMKWEIQEPIGPIITCRDPHATVLGMLHASPGTDSRGNPISGVEFETGLVVKGMDGWRSVWCGVPDLPASLLRGIARYAGVHIYNDGDNFLCVNNSMVSVHTRYAGMQVINLPRPARVVDAFNGKVVSEQTRSFRVNLKQYETGMWWLE